MGLFFPFNFQKGVHGIEWGWVQEPMDGWCFEQNEMCAILAHLQTLALSWQVCSGKNDKKTSSDVLARATDSLADLKVDNDVEFQQLRQRIEEMIEGAENRIEEQEKKIGNISSSLDDILKILRDMNLKTS